MSLIHSNIIAIGEAGIGGLRSVTDPIQFSIDICKADNAMFEALIQCDFMEAVCESGEISQEDYQVALEAAGEGIWQKIKDFFRKALDFITGFFKKAVDFVTHLFDKDARLFKKYEQYVSKATGFDANGDFEYVDMKLFNEFISFEANDLCENVENTINVIKDMESKEQIEDMLKKIKDAIEASEKERNEDFKNIIKKASGGKDLLSKINTKDLTTFIIAGKSTTIKKLKSEFELSKRRLNAMKTAIEHDKSKGTKDENPELVAARYNAIFSILTIYQKMTNSGKSAVLQAIKEAYRVNRKLFITLGQYGMKQSGKKDDTAEEKAATESYYWALGNISDTYVEETYVEAFA